VKGLMGKRTDSARPLSGQPPVAGDFDVVVMGAGVLGCAVAARLAQGRLRVAVLETAADVAEGASKGNAGITSSYYAPFGTLEGTLIAESNAGWEALCAKLDVPYRRIGALTVALDDEGVVGLDRLEADVRRAGTKVERISGEAAREDTEARRRPPEGHRAPMGDRPPGPPRERGIETSGPDRRIAALGVVPCHRGRPTRAASA